MPRLRLPWQGGCFPSVFSLNDGWSLPWYAPALNLCFIIFFLSAQTLIKGRCPNTPFFLTNLGWHLFASLFFMGLLSDETCYFGGLTPRNGRKMPCFTNLPPILRAGDRLSGNGLFSLPKPFPSFSTWFHLF